LCFYLLTAAAGAQNLDQDSSCGATLHGSLSASFRPLDANAAAPTLMPVYASATIDAAASCNDSNSQSVADDQQGTPRPQDTACDLGAVEADYIFVNPFE